jgi:Protein of unknown function (DUF3175)
MRAKKTASERSPKRGEQVRWVAKVKTDSTHPPEGLFTRDAETIAKTLASKKVSPKGAASGMRMLTYYINRAGRNLSAERRTTLHKAQSLLAEIIARERRSREKKKSA